MSPATIEQFHDPLREEVVWRIRLPFNAAVAMSPEKYRAMVFALALLRVLFEPERRALPERATLPDTRSQEER